jgi:mRNA interferase YafQ
MRTIKVSPSYKRDIKRESRGKYKQILETELLEIIEMLANDSPLPEKHKDHQLGGQLKDLRDCHVRSDLLLLYSKTEGGELRILRLVRLGSHSELFG